MELLRLALITQFQKLVGAWQTGHAKKRRPALFPETLSTETNPVERRRYPRVPSFNLVKVERAYHLVNVMRFYQAPFGCLFNLEDLSESGLRFTCPEKYDPNTVLVLRLNLAEKGREIPVDGRVIWVKKKRSSRRYHFGIDFLAIEEEDRQLIRELVQTKFPPHDESHSETMAS